MIPAVAVLIVFTGCGLWLLFARKRGEPRRTPAQRIIRAWYWVAFRHLAAARALDTGYLCYRQEVAGIRIRPVNEDSGERP